MINLKSLAADKYRISLDESAKIDPSREERPWYYRIPCKYGHIGVWGENMLSAFTDRRNVRGRLTCLCDGDLVQHGDAEITMTFSPSMLDAVADLLQARRKRQLSDEQKAALAARGKAFFLAYRASATAQDASAGVSTVDGADCDSPIAVRHFQGDSNAHQI